jgi:hypothetical protein
MVPHCRHCEDIQAAGRTLGGQQGLIAVAAEQGVGVHILFAFACVNVAQQLAWSTGA